MAASEESMRGGVAWPWWRWVMTGLSAAGLALSVYLSWHYLAGGSVIGCGGGGGCDQVLSSRWSSVRGVVPVSGLAAGTYLAMLLASFFVGPGTAAADRRLAWSALLVLAGAALGSAAWFIIVQKWFVGSFCPYCMAAHITGLLLAGVVIGRSREGAPEFAMGRGPATGLALGGLLLAGILATLQVSYAPPAAYRAGALPVNAPVIDPHGVPLVGSPDAPYVVTLLFDYQCPHCQRLHGMLEEAIRRYDGKVAFALCPAPLNIQCNPYIARYAEEFKDSCAIARIGLAVWLARREAFAEFDRWIFSAEPGEGWHPRSLDAARARAVELVGQAKFDAARSDPWIDRHLETSVRIYGATMLPDQSGGSVPKLVFGARWVTPEPNSVDELVGILQRDLGVPGP